MAIFINYSDDYYALYHLNVASDAQRAAFMAKIERAMRRL
jgi:hypothetical protein